MLMVITSRRQCFDKQKRFTSINFQLQIIPRNCSYHFVTPFFFPNLSYRPHQGQVLIRRTLDYSTEPVVPLTVERSIPRPFQKIPINNEARWTASVRYA